MWPVWMYSNEIGGLRADDDVVDDVEIRGLIADRELGVVDEHVVRDERVILEVVGHEADAVVQEDVVAKHGLASPIEHHADVVVLEQVVRDDRRRVVRWIVPVFAADVDTGAIPVARARERIGRAARNLRFEPCRGT